MTVSFRTTLIDAWHRLSYLSFRTVPGKCLLALILVSPVIAHALILSQAAPGLILTLAFWLPVAATYCGCSIGLLISYYLSPFVVPRTTVSINQHGCCWRQIWAAKIPWRDFDAISEGAAYFYFVGRRRAVFIPKRAFRSGAKAEAFFNTAYGYWREAKEAAAPHALDMSGVWPPAPRATDFQEPGETPKQ